MPRTPHKQHRKPQKIPRPSGGAKLKKKTSESKKKEAPVSASVVKLLAEPVTNKHLVTRAALRRAACRAGIRCISKDCIDALMVRFDETANECLLQARNNAYYVRKAKTITSSDIVTGSRETGLGDVLVC